MKVSFRGRLNIPFIHTMPEIVTKIERKVNPSFSGELEVKPGDGYVWIFSMRGKPVDINWVWMDGGKRCNVTLPLDVFNTGVDLVSDPFISEY